MDTVAELTLIRHGESLANVAFAEARARGLSDHGLTGRDADIELSSLGWKQAARLGHWLAALPDHRRPEVVVCSPYVRARQTWLRAAETAAQSGVDHPTAAVDHRLCDRLMGDLELLTPAMIAQRFPAESALLSAEGEFSYRPPGGESFGDIAGRLAAVLTDLNAQHAGRRVLLVAHDAVIVVMRHLIEGLSFDEIAVIVAAAPVANTSITRYDGTDGGLTLMEFAVTPHFASGEVEHAFVGR
ncbi:histidine phosphatase family protein [Solwaraspora sp. WMMD1047]|uniref:histidine phosphatase family protein n=1 Tax=Solwaraspora sp. WMMD1047 TaxID=3016102 RepID=UPI002416260B|nr:histidine phosphatase family protein [Solwaraspora sp. WMMD1047]MDG4831502.1 histidine phosphatase family protein [Solwaraspora sp. WMMD1047]